MPPTGPSAPSPRPGDHHRTGELTGRLQPLSCPVRRASLIPLLCSDAGSSNIQQDWEDGQITGGPTAYQLQPLLLIRGSSWGCSGPSWASQDRSSLRGEETGWLCWGQLCCGCSELYLACGSHCMVFAFQEAIRNRLTFVWKPGNVAKSQQKGSLLVLCPT